MGKCLITRLQERVDAPGLKKLGEIVFVLTPNESWNITDNKDSWPMIRTNDNGTCGHATLTIEGDAEFYNYEGTTALGKSVQTSTLSSMAVRLRAYSQAPITIHVGNKYAAQSFGGQFSPLASDIWPTMDPTELAYCSLTDLERLDLCGSDLSGLNLDGLRNIWVRGTRLDIANLANANSLKTVRCIFNSNEISGDIAAFQNKSELTALELSGQGITGELSSLVSSTRLTYLTLYNTAVTGDLKTLADAFHAHGRTSGVLDVSAGKSPGIYMTGYTFTNHIYITFTAEGWTASTSLPA